MLGTVVESTVGREETIDFNLLKNFQPLQTLLSVLDRSNQPASLLHFLASNVFVAGQVFDGW